MKRRQFLLSILGGLVCGFGLREGRTSSTTAFIQDNHQFPESIAARIEPLFSDVESAREVGRRYLARFPDQANHTLLLERSGLAGLPQDSPAEPTLLRKALDRRRQQDFLTGNTVTLDGWILAQSEVDLCALLALSE